MPTIDHHDLGDIQRHVYLTGSIVRVFPEKDDIPAKDWDTADVLVDGYAYTWNHAPIFYHCNPLSLERENGAIIDGAKGFVKGDKVVLFCEITTPRVGEQRQIDNVVVIGHKEGPIKCTYNIVMVRCSLKELPPLDLEDLAANPGEFCTMYDVAAKGPAKIPDPDNPKSLLEFPCPVVKVKPFLLHTELRGVTMFESFPQGNEDDDMEIAGFVPNWTDDGMGDKIRGNEAPKDWWTSYNVEGNPVNNLFEDMSFAIMLDDEGAALGTYQDTMDILESHESKISKWDSRSPAFGQDHRSYPVKGAKDLNKANAIGTDGHALKPADSRHIQTAFGENEIWVCAVNSYDGMIVSYCDAMWKFIRMEDFPPNIPIPGLIENWISVADKAAIGGALPGGMAGGAILGDISVGIAGMITLAGKGGENSIWSYGGLKRVNEGCFHRTQHPAMKGSLLLRTLPIPEDKEKEPSHLSAINFRLDNIDVWYRHDNWMNTFGILVGSFGVDTTWWFHSQAQKWGCEAVYVDTPLGSMWFQSPNWKACVWYLYSMQMGSAMMSARQDKPLLQEFKMTCKHSRTVGCQLYVNQRTAITLWSKLEDKFVMQMVGVDPYHCIPSENGEDPVAYANMPDGDLKHFDTLTSEDIESLVSDRIFLWSESKKKTESLRLSRNEIEIMGAAELYADLQEGQQRRNPVDQERTPEFEKSIQELIEKVVEPAESKFAPIFLDMEII
ncbi:MAG: hypothetical protein JEZ12_13080 [Desulfobacterium sp.]|nr:hypothetical protein [Desulfobacterium sp.]